MSARLIISDTRVKVNSFSTARKLRFLGDVSVTEDAVNDRFDVTISAGGGGGGTVQSASNVGTGSGWFKQLNGSDLEFKTIRVGSNKISVTSNANDLTLDIVEANLTLGNLSGTIGNAEISDLSYAKLTGVPASFAPSAHASSHSDGGSDEISVTNLGGFTGSSTNFLRADGTFAVPPGSGSSGMGSSGGTASLNGDSSTKIFTIAHGLGGVPTGISVMPSSTDAFGDYQVDKDATNITITYQSAPPTGTGNVVFEWMAVIGAVNNVHVAKGNAIKSGDSSTKVFTIAHGMSSIPASVWVEPASVDALGEFSRDVDATNITITYQIAPSTGTNNLEYYWGALNPTGGLVGTGEANTMSNLGSGLGVFKQKNVFDFELKSLVQGTDIALTNNANDITISAGANVLNTTNSKTVTNKTIDRITNIIKNSGSFKYSIFKDGSTYYCINNLTGAIEVSDSSPNTILQFPLTNGGSVFVHGGDYVLTGAPSVYFDFPVEPLYCQFEMAADTRIVVPAGYTGIVFRMKNSATQHCTGNSLIGGKIEETNTISKDWTGILLESTGNNVASKGVYSNTIRNLTILWPNIGIKLNCDSDCDTGFTNFNYFEDLFIGGAKRSMVEFGIDDTYVAGTNGVNRNRFTNVGCQNSNTAHMLVGFRDVRHRENMFIGCYVVDFGGSNVAGMTIHADATDTTLVGGTCDTYNFTNAGTDTKRFTEAGLQIDKIIPSNGTNIDIVPTGASLTTSFWNSTQNERWYIQENATQHLIDFVKQSGGSLKPAVFRQNDATASAVESFRILTDGKLQVYTNNFALLDSNQSHYYNFVTSDISANRNITIPALSGNDTLPFLGVANVFTATQTISGSAAYPFITYRATSTLGDEIGGISFNGNNASAAAVQYAGLTASITANTAGAESGQLKFQTKLAGVLANAMVLTHQGNAFIGRNVRLGLSETGLTAQRTFTFPDATTTVVGIDTTQTLTNKTITAPIMSSYQDLDRIATPADPSANRARLYNKQIDNNNDGIFTKVKRDGAFAEIPLYQRPNNPISTGRKWGSLVGISPSPLNNLGLTVTAAATQASATGNLLQSIGRYVTHTTQTTTGNNAGGRVASLIMRAHNPYWSFRGRLGAGSTAPLMRTFFGFSSDAGNDPTASNTYADSKSVAMIGHRPGVDTNWQFIHNDGSGTALYEDTGAAVNTSLRTFEIIGDDTNSRWGWSIDGSAISWVTTQVPAPTTTLGIIHQIQTNDSGVAKSFDLMALYIEFDTK